MEMRLLDDFHGDFGQVANHIADLDLLTLRQLFCRYAAVTGYDLKAMVDLDHGTPERVVFHLEDCLLYTSCIP